MKKEFDIKAYLRKAVVVNGEKLLSFSPAPSSVLLLKNMLFDYELNDCVTLTIRPYSNDDDRAINRYFHKVARFYYNTGLHSYSSFDELKRGMMKCYGKGIELYVYHDGNKWVQVKKENEVPPGVDAYGWVGSWADYSRNEKYETTQGMISEMKDVGVSGVAFDKLIGEAEK